MWRFLTFAATCLMASGVCAAPISDSALISGTAALQNNLISTSMDPSDIVNGQFAALPGITCDSSPSDVVDWLVGMDEIFTRISTGGLSSIPPNGLIAIKTMANDISGTPNLINDAVVLQNLLHVLPSLWDIGFWYRPVSEWKTEFGVIFNKAVTAAKASPDDTCYDAAVNATSLMIRFTKDQVFLDGEDHGESVALQGQNKDYLAYLPQLVAHLSKQKGFTLTESQLRTFMATKMPSKTEGMDMAAAFPVYVDTSKYKTSDTVALAKLLCG